MLSKKQPNENDIKKYKMLIFSYSKIAESLGSEIIVLAKLIIR
ncbi:hypothetical protein SAMN05216480_10349 [Pustulibacterium marinum]|uniref:Uncharacterized protein n=1 Tax=Pustulibacterium marinum TaxID=1224947 RepID=A0A1I7G151_9FLAO|nr:hypothetical protein SAMN05216480_10349 [Pustulibacterium marinum]